MSPFPSGGTRARAALAATFALALVPACTQPESPTDDEREELASFELAMGELPASPTNAYADDIGAAALGQSLFFERGLSADGTVACVDCHEPSDGFADARRFSEGIEGREGARHALPITSVALLPFLMWDGRADTAWRQPLLALENDREMRFTRTEVARFVALRYREPYERVFGPLPDLDGAPLRGRPGDPDWDALAEAKRDDIQRVFVNVGKAIEAYERRLACADTRFDQWARGDATLSEAELDGAARFVRSGCTGCHDGAAFSDGGFHNLGLSPAGADVVDAGREGVAGVVLQDELNGAGRYSDDPAFGAARLARMQDETRTRGAFRTASLRGVGQRERFGHRGLHTSLVEFIDDTYRRNGRGGDGRGDGDGRGRGDGGDEDIVGSIDPLLDEVNVDGDDAERIADFLRTLDCPEPPDALLAR